MNGGDNDVIVGSLVTIKISLWWEMLIMEEATHVWGQGYLANTRLPNSFSVNLKLLLKVVPIFFFKEKSM